MDFISHGISLINNFSDDKVDPNHDCVEAKANQDLDIRPIATF